MKTIEVAAAVITDGDKYNYPNFHLTLHCYICKQCSGNLTLLEHKEARWLTQEELDNLDWLPADLELIRTIKGLRLT